MGDLIYILLAIAECGVLYSFSGLCYPHRKQTMLRRGLGVGLFAITVFFSAGNRVIFDIQFTLQMAFLQTVFFTALLYIIYKMKFIFSFSISFFYFSAIGLMESAGLSLLKINKNFEAYYQWFWQPYTVYLAVLMIIFLTLWTVLGYRKYIKKGKNYFPLKSGILITLGIVAQLLSIIYLNFQYLGTTHGLWLSMLLGGIAFFGVIAFLVISKSYARTIYESRLVRQQDIQLKNQLKEMERSEEEKAKLLHDHKHDFLLLKQLACDGQYNELVEALNQRLLSIGQTKKKYYTGNASVDFVLGMKEARAVCENIDFQVECTTLREVPASYDLCILLSNLLDNALEACKKMGEKRSYIKVKLGSQGQMIWVHIFNSCNKMPVVKGGKFITSKTDKSIHGYGLMSVRQIVERYHGSIDFDYDTTYFNVKILMGFQEGRKND